MADLLKIVSRHIFDPIVGCLGFICYSAGLETVDGLVKPELVCEVTVKQNISACSVKTE